MAILLRSQGILVREVNGFLGGRWNDFGQYLAVTQNQCQGMTETETLACILANATEDPTGRDCVVTFPVQEPDPI